MSDMPCPQTPGKWLLSRHYASTHVDFRLTENVVLPDLALTGLNHFSLTAYGLSTRCPTLNRRRYRLWSKDSLPGGRLTLPGRASHPLKYATLPGRTSNEASIVRKALGPSGHGNQSRAHECDGNFNAD
ncbi:MAG: hypothetical protein PHI06_07660 [Desulfobulbaceae bacterium]|nr:hypothetical protein [Desulfobulbaceae bacterium]